MLKKFLHIALSLYLLAITAGVAVNKHYCGDSVVSTALFLKAQPCTDMDGAMEKTCCHDELAFFQLDDDFTSSQNLQFQATADFNLIVPEFTFLQDIFSYSLPIQEKNQVAYSPPLLFADITIEVQSFLI